MNVFHHKVFIKKIKSFFGMIKIQFDDMLRKVILL